MNSIIAYQKGQYIEFAGNVSIGCSDSEKIV